MTLPIDGLKPAMQKELIQMQSMDRAASEERIIDFILQQTYSSKTKKNKETND
jgi:hypothetical protein